MLSVLHIPSPKTKDMGKLWEVMDMSIILIGDDFTDYLLMSKLVKNIH